MDLRLKKCSALLAVAVLTSFLTVNVARAAEEVDTWDALKHAITNASVSEISLTGNISGANSNLGNQAATNLTIDGNNFTLSGTNGEDKYAGITVEAGKSLTITDVGTKVTYTLAEAPALGANVTESITITGIDNGIITLSNGKTAYLSGANELVTIDGAFSGFKKDVTGAVAGPSSLTVPTEGQSVNALGGAVQNSGITQINNTVFADNSVKAENT